MSVKEGKHKVKWSNVTFVLADRAQRATVRSRLTFDHVCPDPVVTVHGRTRINRDVRAAHDVIFVLRKMDACCGEDSTTGS